MSETSPIYVLCYGEDEDLGPPASFFFTEDAAMQAVADWNSREETDYRLWRVFQVPTNANWSETSYEAPDTFEIKAAEDANETELAEFFAQVTDSMKQTGNMASEMEAMRARIANLERIQARMATAASSAGG